MKRTHIIFFAALALSMLQPSRAGADETVMYGEGSPENHQIHAREYGYAAPIPGTYRQTSQTSDFAPRPVPTPFHNYFSAPGRQYALAMATNRGPLVQSRKQVRGSGFYVGPDLIMTNAHVVRKCSQIIVNDNLIAAGTAVAAIDPDRDVALIRTDILSDVWARISPANVAVGAVTVAGYPTEGKPAPSYEQFDGRVVRTQTSPTVNRLHFSGHVKKGNSGGPVIDASGDVAGIVVGRVKLLYASREGGDFRAAQSSGIAVGAGTVRGFLRRSGVTPPPCGTERCLYAEPQDYVAKIACMR